MKNKKGFGFALLLPIVAVIVVIAIILAFMFSGTLRYYIMGAGILLGTFVFAIPAYFQNEVTRGKSAVIVILLGLGVLFLVVPSVLQVAYTGTFVKPMWARMECEAEDTQSIKEITITKDWANAANLITCGRDELVDKCSIYLDAASSHWYTTNSVRVKYRQCDQNGANCAAETSKIITRGTQDEWIKDLDAGKSIQVVVESEALGVNMVADFKNKYNLFKLFDFFGGGKRLINAAGCSIPVSAKNFVEKGEKSQEEYDSCASGTIAKDDWCNYVHDWAYGPASNVFTHSTYGEVYCTGGSIYDIVELTTESGQVKKVDPSYSTTKQDGEIFKGLGKFLANVECCPSQPNCNDDFEWDTGHGTTCYTDAQCQNGGAWFFIAPKQVNREACVDDKCTLQTPVTVLCARDADCGNGQVCQKVGDIANWKCVMGNGSTPDPDLDPNACAELSARYPFMGYVFIETSTSTCGWNPLCGIGIMAPTVTKESKCSPTFLPYWIIGGIVFVIVIIVVILLIPKKGSKKKRSRR